jgi:hypothetical protein
LNHPGRRLNGSEIFDQAGSRSGAAAEESSAVQSSGLLHPTKS